MGGRRRRLRHPLHGLWRPVLLRRVPLGDARRPRLEPHGPVRRVLPLRLRLHRPRARRGAAHRPLGAARGHRSGRRLPRRGLGRDGRRARAVASVRVLRDRGRRRHVGRLRAVQRHRGALVRAATRARRRPRLRRHGAGHARAPPGRARPHRPGGLALGLRHLRGGHLHRVEPGRHRHAAGSRVRGPRPRRRCRTGALGGGGREP